MIRLALAFLRRDLLIWSSYRLAVLWQVLGILVIVVLTYAVATTLGDRPEIGGQSGSYIAFVLSGIAFTDVLAQAIGAPSQAISENQKAGTLEPMLLTRVSGVRLVVSSALFRLSLSLGRMLVYLAVGTAIFGYWRSVNVVTALLVFVPALVGFLAIGMLAAGFIVLVKQGDPVLLAYAWLTGLLGGAIFPTTVLPVWAQPLTVLVPLTHALAGIRAALEGAPPQVVLDRVAVMAVMAVVCWPLGLLTFSWAITRAKQEGSLGQY